MSTPTKEDLQRCSLHSPCRQLHCALPDVSWAPHQLHPPHHVPVAQGLAVAHQVHLLAVLTLVAHMELHRGSDTRSGERVEATYVVATSVCNTGAREGADGRYFKTDVVMTRSGPWVRVLEWAKPWPGLSPWWWVLLGAGGSMRAPKVQTLEGVRLWLGAGVLLTLTDRLVENTLLPFLV